MSQESQDNQQHTSHREVPQWTAILGLFLARFTTAAWVGAATLFVVVGVTEVTRGGFDMATKDRLVAVRFPAFYVFGFTLITLSLIGTGLARALPEFSNRRRLAVLVALAFAMALMITDYLTIYRALLDMVEPPGDPKPPHFVQYHEWSKWINLTELLFCLTSVGLLNWPHHRRSNPT